MGSATPEPGVLEKLVEDARAGSRAAFGALWEAFSPVVAGYVRGRGVREPDDVTSEIFLAAFQRLPAFTGDGAAFRRWLFTIAHHRAADEVRARSRRPVEAEYDPDRDLRKDAAAEEVALANAAGSEVLALLSTLSPEQREVVLLRIVADLPVADVAQILSRSPEAVRQLQVRALNRLRRQFPGGGRGVTPGGSLTIAQA
ncbi:MAG TPA: sigma-70 family RNA polymerase sigma factor [Sporichthya sp.]|nr:sigma-70 family RNA polymerase sigma factor [Sporichthya sp.]